jgi:D-alanine-D-alanine ligase
MKTVAVIFGGKSAEHDVSIVTALGGIIKPLEASGNYVVEVIYIAKDGSWHWDDKLKDINLYSKGGIADFLQNDPAVSVTFDGGLSLSKSIKLGRKKTATIDVAFPATHGTYGEDGSLMGLLRMAGIPFVGCDMEASVIAMNKLLSHQVISALGIEQYEYRGVQKTGFENNRAACIARLEGMNYPVFVKPVHLGSSIAITRVASHEEIANALEVAFHYDNLAIVEEAVQNLIEVTVPIMGNTDDLQVAYVEKPLIAEGSTFDFETKYLKQGGGKKSAKSGAQGYSELPAKLPDGLYEKCELLAKDVYTAFGCEGTARIDLLIDSVAGKVYFNEINPLPGDLYSHNWRAKGVSSVQLVTELIQLAERRHEETKNRTTSFSTNYLKQF